MSKKQSVKRVLSSVHTLPKARADWGTQELWQHVGRCLEVTGAEAVCVARVLEEHPLDLLREAKAISKAQSDAAFRFKRDFQAAQLEDHLVASYAPRLGVSAGFGGVERSDVAEAAYTRWRAAMRAMGAPYHNLIMTAVCHDKTPPKALWPMIQVGLERLEKWYNARGLIVKSTTVSCEKKRIKPEY